MLELLIVGPVSAAVRFKHIPVEPWNCSIAFSVVIFACARGRLCFARFAACVQRQDARPT